MGRRPRLDELFSLTHQSGQRALHLPQASHIIAYSYPHISQQPSPASVSHRQVEATSWILYFTPVAMPSDESFKFSCFDVPCTISLISVDVSMLLVLVVIDNYLYSMRHPSPTIFMSIGLIIGQQNVSNSLPKCEIFRSTPSTNLSGSVTLCFLRVFYTLILSS